MTKSDQYLESALDDDKDFVYWIHLRHENDPFLHGYIGVTNDLETRWRRHRRHVEKDTSKRNRFPLYQAFRKYGLDAFRFDVLAGPLDKWSAYNLEYALRPHAHIGYNLQWGGYWRSCLLCSTLSPRRLSRTGIELIEEHIQEVVTYQLEKAKEGS